MTDTHAAASLAVDTNSCLASALAAVRAGISVWPPRQDGSKAPDTSSWKSRQRTRATDGEVEALYKGGRTGVGWVTGAISGNLEVLDFDDRSTWAEYQKLCRDSGVGPLLERVSTGYLEHTPNGVHLVYRCAEIEGNQKLAQRILGERERKALIETRGEGGYIIVAPSHGSVNPKGAYTLVSGGVASIATITPAERQDLFDVARIFDEAPKPQRTEVHVPAAGRPGDDFNARATWEEILEPHGWSRVSSRLGVVSWRRPAKDQGISATTNHADSGLLYVFSTSTVFEANRGYSKFSAFALLNHNGDFSAAAHELSLKGYGAEVVIDPGIDLSLLLASIDKKQADDAPRGLDADLFRVPGLVGELAEWINETSHKPQPVLALGAAIAGVATIIGRKVRTRSGLRSNIYVLGVAPSGTGKERAREALRQVFDAAGAGDMAAYDSVASDAGINNALSATPACLLLLDEAGREFSQMLSANAPTHVATIVSVLLKLYGASATTYYGKTYADKERRLKVEQPCLSIYGTTVPRNLWGSMTPEQVNDGFLGRFLVFESPDEDPEFREIEWRDPPARIVDQFVKWHELETRKEGGGNLERLENEPRVIEMSPDASRVFADLEADMRRRRAEASGDGVDPGIYMRVGTSARKLALIRACGITHERLEISEADAAWGARLATTLTVAMADKVKRFAADGRYEAELKRVVEVIRKARRGISKSDLCRRTQWLNRRTREEILAHLTESRAIVAEQETTKGRPLVRYYLSD